MWQSRSACVELFVTGSNESNVMFRRVKYEKGHIFQQRKKQELFKTEYSEQKKTGSGCLVVSNETMRCVGIVAQTEVKHSIEP